MLSLIIAAERGDWDGVDISKITDENINSIRHGGKNLLHVAACARQLEKVPKKLLSPTGLLDKDTKGDTVLHVAARFEEFYVIPKSLLNLESIETANREGNTVLHFLCAKGNLRDLPKKLITDRNLSLVNSSGKSSLNYAIDSWQDSVKRSQTLKMKGCIHLILENLGTQRLKTLHEQYRKSIKEFINLRDSIASVDTKASYNKLIEDKSRIMAMLTQELHRRVLIELKTNESIDI